MTIDERLEKLAERHEALTQTVEIIAGIQKENDRRWADTDRRFLETDKRIGQVLEAIIRLGNIAEAHEHRLDDLEGQ